MKAVLCTFILKALKVPEPMVVKFPCRVVFPSAVKFPATFTAPWTVSELEKCASCPTERPPPTISVDVTCVFPEIYAMVPDGRTVGGCAPTIRLLTNIDE